MPIEEPFYRPVFAIEWWRYGVFKGLIAGMEVLTRGLVVFSSFGGCNLEVHPQ